MNVFRTATLIAGCTLLCSRANAQADAAKRDVAALQGSWSMLWGENDGQRFAGIMLTGSTRTAKADTTTVYISGALYMQATFTLDPSKKPNAIDYAMIGGATAGKSQLGIYRLMGDTVEFCFAEPGVARPTEFKAPAGTQRTCSGWQRTKR